MSTVDREPKAEQGLPFSPGVVGSIPTTPEWRQYNGLQHEELGLVLTSDASGNWRCGGLTDRGAWFQLPWSRAWESAHITNKKFLPIVLGCATWR